MLLSAASAEEARHVDKHRDSGNGKSDVKQTWPFGNGNGVLGRLMLSSKNGMGRPLTISGSIIEKTSLRRRVDSTGQDP